MAYTVTDRDRVFDGVKVKLEVHTVADDAGKSHTREVVVHGGAVLILGVNPEQEVLMIRVHRYPVGEHLWELPAGTIEGPDDDPMRRAKLELKEETGHDCGRIEVLGSFYTSPGILTERMHCFVATDLTAGEQALEEGEDITVHPTPLAECLAMIDRGEIVDGKTIAALLMYAQKVGT